MYIYRTPPALFQGELVVLDPAGLPAGAYKLQPVPTELSDVHIYIYIYTCIHIYIYMYISNVPRIFFRVSLWSSTQPVSPRVPTSFSRCPPS